MEQALRLIECPTGAFWAGDFNPRLDKKSECCPFDKLKYLMKHGQAKAVTDLTLSADPITKGTSWRKDKKGGTPFVLDDWQCSGDRCEGGWHELPVGFVPTFHKIFHRHGWSYSKKSVCAAPSGAVHNMSFVGLSDGYGPVKGNHLVK